MKQYIKGKYTRSIFESNNGYIIGLFKVKETNDEEIIDYVDKTITFTGYFAELNKDDSYVFYGESVEHPKYGFQYQVNEYERLKPEDKEGLIAFFSSDLFPGIGNQQATKIVETLGNNVINDILDNPNILMRVPKISTKKANQIYNILKDHEESNTIIVYLSDLGFNMQDSLSIYNFYKSNTIRTIEHNIYSIIDDIDISFLKIDQVAKNIGIDLNDKIRIKAAIIYVIKQLLFKNGDTYLYEEEIKNNIESYLNFTIEMDLFNQLIDELRYESKIIKEDEKYYLKDIYDSEKRVVEKINVLLKKEKTKYNTIDTFIKNTEKENKITYNNKQLEAIKKALMNNITIITGGPGTGKTTIIKSIIDIYKGLNKLDENNLIERIALLAPTGRASKRLSESTLLPATTIHRFLKWNKETNEFNINEYNKDRSELIIIDEVSMIDISLLDNLFKGLTDNIKLVLVGDYNQLPSVGPGQILKDMIESNTIETIYLDLLYRQSEKSYITKLAYDIKEGNLNDEYLETKDDYTFLTCNGSSIVDNLRYLCNKLKEKNIENIQLMAPMYAGINGIDSLNKELQSIFNPKDNLKNEIQVGDVIFREGDKILQLVNMPDENVFNGDIGYIKYISLANTSKSKKNEIYVDYDGLTVKYLPKDFNKIKHGYIITIHKSQGSEFDFVIIPICSSYRRMLYKKLIYTAITRAKKKLILIGEPNSFIYAVNNNNDLNRKTNLKEKLEKICINQ